MNQAWEYFAARDYDDSEIAVAIEVLNILKEITTPIEDTTGTLRANIEVIIDLLSDIEIDLEAHND